jgi:hypothetical protein
METGQRPDKNKNPTVGFWQGRDTWNFPPNDR